MSINVLHKNLLKINNNDVFVNNNNNNNNNNNKSFNSSLLQQNVDNNNVDNRAENDIKFCVNNVVCSYSTRCHLNLRKIAMEGMHVEYKKENGMVNMKLRNPNSTASIWSSGKITCTGSKSETDAYKAARCYCRLLQKLGFKVKLCNYRVVNVLATCSMSFEIDINKLANHYPKDCSYEPELHPGATFTMKDIKSTLKIFTTGSVTLTAPSVSTIEAALKRICPILNNYRMAKAPTITSSINNNNNNIESFKNNFNDLSNSNKIILNNSHVYHHPLHHHHHPITAPLNLLYNNNINNNNNNQFIQTNTNYIAQTNNIATYMANNTYSYNNNNNISINNSYISNNINNNGFNLLHSGSSNNNNNNNINNTKHKSFLTDDMDEEFLP